MFIFTEHPKTADSSMVEVRDVPLVIRSQARLGSSRVLRVFCFFIGYSYTGVLTLREFIKLYT